MARAQKRLWVVGASLALGFTVLVVRAAQVQLVEGDQYAERAAAQRTDSVELPAPRGALYDRNGVPLASTVEVMHVGIDAGEFRAGGGDPRFVARQLGLSEREIRRRLRRRYAHFEGPFSAAQVLALRQYPGIYLSSDLVRSYPDPNFARAVIGRPAEQGHPGAGLELELDSLLRGEPGHAVELRDGRGQRFESPARLRAFPVAGDDVFLTLDVSMQEIAETSLDEAIDRLNAKGGDVVMLDPRSGEILALASRTAGARSAGALVDVFEPGSTAKVFAAAALLEDGLVEPTDSVFGEHGTWVEPHRTIHDDHPEDMPTWLTLADAIRVSSNIGSAKFADRLSPAQQYEMLRAFGLGTLTAIEFPAESRGRLFRPDQWSGTTAQSLAIGYEVSVTALQLAQAYAAIANDGVLLQPTLVKRVRDASGRVTYEHLPEPVRRVVRPEVAKELRDMLRDVVGEGGTGVNAALRTYELAGKTGTARRVSARGYTMQEHTAVFAALFPATDPQLVTVVKLDNPHGTYAAQTAAPLTRRMLEEALAARTNGLDLDRLARGSVPADRHVHVARAGQPARQVFAWPLTSPADSPPVRRIPDVRGLSARDAVARLQRLGLRVRLDGVGEIVSSSPSPGDSLRVGHLVTLRTSNRGPS